MKTWKRDLLFFLTLTLVAIAVFWFASIVISPQQTIGQGIYAYRVKPVSSLPTQCLPGNGEVVF